MGIADTNTQHSIKSPKLLSPKMLAFFRKNIEILENELKFLNSDILRNQCLAFLVQYRSTDKLEGEALSSFQKTLRILNLGLRKRIKFIQEKDAGISRPRNDLLEKEKEEYKGTFRSGSSRKRTF